MMTLYFTTLVGQAFAAPENVLQSTSVKSILTKEEKEIVKKEAEKPVKKSNIPTSGVYFETSGLPTYTDITDDFLSYELQMIGIRVTRDLNKNLSLLASWNIGGSIVNTDNYYYDYDYYYDEEVYYQDANIETLTTINQLSSGVRYSYRITAWLHPYATAQAIVQHGHLLLTDDYDSERRLFEFKSGAFGVGGSGSLGFELRTGKIAKKYKLALFVERGYAATTPLQFKYQSEADDAEKLPLGNLRFGGGYSNVGIGLKF